MFEIHRFKTYTSLIQEKIKWWNKKKKCISKLRFLPVFDPWRTQLIPGHKKLKIKNLYSMYTSKAKLVKPEWI